MMQGKIYEIPGFTPRNSLMEDSQHSSPTNKLNSLSPQRYALFEGKQELDEIMRQKQIDDQFVIDEIQQSKEQPPLNTITSNIIGLSPSTLPRMKTKYIDVFGIVARFVAKILQVKKRCHPQNLNPFQKYIFNDLTDFYVAHDDQKYQKEKAIKETTLKRRKNKQNLSKQNKTMYFQSWNKQESILLFLDKFTLPLFSPNHSLIVAEQVCTFFLSVVCVFYHPFELAFLPRDIEEADFKYFIQRCIFFFFILHLILQFNLKYYKYGSLVQTRREVTRHYLRTDFIQDILLVILLSIEQTYYRATINFLRTSLFLWRTLYRSEVTARFLDRLCYNDQLQATKGICILFAQIILCCHIAACYFYLLGTRSQQEEGESWLDIAKINNNDISNQYICSFYFMSITMITIGYGDIYPVTQREQMFLIFMSFFASGIVGYTINSIGTILVEIDQKRTQSQQKVKLITQYLQNHQLQSELINRARNYVEFVLKQEIDTKEDPGTCLNMLSPFLRFEIEKKIKFNTINQIRFLAQNFSQQFLSEVSMKIHEKVYPPDDIIFKQGIKKQPSLYFVQNGRIELFFQFGEVEKSSEEKIKTLQICKENEYFGQFEFFADNRNLKLSARSQGITVIQFLTLEDFMEVIKQYPQDYQKFLFLRNQVVFQQKLNAIEINCFSCGSPEHVCIKCPSLSYCQKQFELVASNLLKSDKIFQKRFKRSLLRKKSSNNTFQQFNFNLNKMEAYQSNNKDLLQDYDAENIDDQDFEDETPEIQEEKEPPTSSDHLDSPRNYGKLPSKKSSELYQGFSTQKSSQFQQGQQDVEDISGNFSSAISQQRNHFENSPETNRRKNKKQTFVIGSSGNGGLSPTHRENKAEAILNQIMEQHNHLQIDQQLSDVGQNQHRNEFQQKTVAGVVKPNEIQHQQFQNFQGQEVEHRSEVEILKDNRFFKKHGADADDDEFTQINQLQFETVSIYQHFYPNGNIDQIIQKITQYNNLRVWKNQLLLSPNKHNRRPQKVQIGAQKGLQNPRNPSLRLVNVNILEQSVQI